jgi:hypothetical protein
VTTSKNHLLIMIMFLLATLPAFGRQKQIDVTGAGAVSEFQGDKVRYSLNAKGRFTTFPSNGGLGFIFVLNMNNFVTAYDVGAVFGFRFGKATFYEAGAGVLLRGYRKPEPLVAFGFGIPISGKFFITFPFHWQFAEFSLIGVRWGPYLGFRL